MKYQGLPGPVQQAVSSIQVLDRFQRINSAQDHIDEFGREPDPFLDTQMVKYWADPNAMSARGDFVTYEVIELDENDLPIITTMRMPKVIASRYNIPSLRENILNPLGLPVCPMPVRKLVEPEAIERRPMAGLVVVNKQLLAMEAQKDPLVRIEAKLEKIASKLGVVL